MSQSGETLDTLAAVKTARAKGAHILAVANVIDSAIPRASDGALYTHAGPEIGVASTKCFTTQLVAMLLLAVYLGRRRGSLAQSEAQRVLEALARTPQQMRDVLAKAEDVRALAKRYMRASTCCFSAAARASRSRSRGRSSSRRSRTSTPRDTPPAR